MKYWIVILIVLAAAGEVIAQTYSDSISVNFFLLDECRISQNMTGEINRVTSLHNEKPFHFRGYFPRESSTLEKADLFAEKYKLTIPVYIDKDLSITKYYGANIAPEVVVYDEVHKKVLYSGRIDNSYDKIGSRRRVVTSRDLAEALSRIKNQNPILVSETQAIGCIL